MNPPAQRRIPGPRLAPRLGALVIGLGLGLAACAASAPERDGGTSAECPVCKHEGDLACVQVSVEADTPCAEFQGRTYCFCSDECRSTFEERPAEYAAGARPLPSPRGP